MDFRFGTEKLQEVKDKGSQLVFNMSFQELLALRGQKLGGKFSTPTPDRAEDGGQGEGEKDHHHHHYRCHDHSQTHCTRSG